VTIGEDRANGTDAFHTRFFFAPNSAGNLKPSATPVPLGPRNYSHSRVSDVCAVLFDCCAYAAHATTNNTAITKVISESDLESLALFMVLTPHLVMAYLSIFVATAGVDPARYLC
jgi:hypothetical protein